MRAPKIEAYDLHLAHQRGDDLEVWAGKWNGGEPDGPGCGWQPVYRTRVTEWCVVVELMRGNALRPRQTTKIIARNLSEDVKTAPAPAEVQAPKTQTATTKRRNAMRSFKVEDYSAKAESRSKGAKDSALVIDVHQVGRGEAKRPSCQCGCGEKPKGAKARFAMGHDARLNGMLVRASLAGVPVELTDGNGKSETVDPIALAKRHGWDATVKASVADYAKRQEAKAKEEEETKAKAK